MSKKKAPNNNAAGEVEVVPLRSEHIVVNEKEEPQNEKDSFDMKSLKQDIESQLKRKQIEPKQAEILKERGPLKHATRSIDKKKNRPSRTFLRTGIDGFDKLFEKGIPKGSGVLVAGGSGSGKTTLCTQILINHAQQGKKCLYMSFEESEERLIEHMEDFGFNPRPLIEKNLLMVKRFNPFDITRSVDALLMKAKGELLIDIEPVIFPQQFKPDLIVVDSLTAIASAFNNKEDSYRIYIEQLFRFFEKVGSTSFFITETKQIPTVFSPTGVEEFLADAVIVIYNIRRGSIREKAIEVLKLRGAPHIAKIVAFMIGEGGVEVYPEQEIFADLDKNM